MNIAHRIARISQELPDKPSVVFPEKIFSLTGEMKYHYHSLSFSEFEARSNQIAHRLDELGIRPGMRTLLFVKPCLDFSVITFSLFKLGAVPVLIDPGMGIKNLLKAIKQVRPEAMISIGRVHWVRRVLSSSFKNIKVKVSLDEVGGRTHYLYQNLDSYSKEFHPLEVSPETTAAILFTSGGTGIPKGVLYTHGILNHQTSALAEMFHLHSSDVDLPGFPLFALFTLAMGMTSVIPDMDPTRPAQCDPAKIVKHILDRQVTFAAGSPAIWERVGRYCVEKNISLPSVRSVVMFGAPVRGEIHQLFKKILPFGTTYTPYGATECLPVALISGREVLEKHFEKMKAGHGTCIGKAAPGIEIKIIKVSDIPVDGLDEVPQGVIGEITVTGPQVTPAYFEMPEETAKAKIVEDGKLWHRMGDVGYLDQQGNLWFCGRKAHVVNDSYPIQVEAIFNRHPEIKRTALVRYQGRPAVVVERKDGKIEFPFKNEMIHELQKRAQEFEHTKHISDFFFHPGFPVDVRHNIKIDRTKLSQGLEER